MVVILAVAAMFQVGQLVEGNILTPKLVGSVGGPASGLADLRAVGLRGAVRVRRLLVAVPVAAAIGVLVRYAIDALPRGAALPRLGSRRTGWTEDADDPEA
jgi:hypothetical protein